MNTEKEKNLNNVFKSLFENKYRDEIFKKCPWYIYVKYNSYYKVGDNYIIEYIALDGDCEGTPYVNSLSINEKEIDNYEN